MALFPLIVFNSYAEVFFKLTFKQQMGLGAESGVTRKH